MHDDCLAQGLQGSLVLVCFLVARESAGQQPSPCEESGGASLALGGQNRVRTWPEERFESSPILCVFVWLWSTSKKGVESRNRGAECVLKRDSS